MFHLIWYVLIGLISGVLAKSVMHVHMTIFWTIVLGIIGSILGGAVTHMFSRPKNEPPREARSWRNLSLHTFHCTLDYGRFLSFNLESSINAKGKSA